MKSKKIILLCGTVPFGTGIFGSRRDSWLFEGPCFEAILRRNAILSLYYSSRWLRIIRRHNSVPSRWCQDLNLDYYATTETEHHSVSLLFVLSQWLWIKKTKWRCVTVVPWPEFEPGLLRHHWDGTPLCLLIIRSVSVVTNDKETEWGSVLVVPWPGFEPGSLLHHWDGTSFCFLIIRAVSVVTNNKETEWRSATMVPWPGFESELVRHHCDGTLFCLFIIRNHWDETNNKETE